MNAWRRVLDIHVCSAAVVAAAFGCGSVSDHTMETVDAREQPIDAPPIDGADQPPQPWQTPVPIASVNTTSDDRTPWLSADGRTLYFSSNRPLGRGSYDVWRAERQSITASFAPAENVTAVNGTTSEESPFVAASGTRIWFSRTVAGAGMEILVATGSAGVWNTPSTIPEVSSTANDGQPMVLANGEAMYLFSRRGANGDADIYISLWSTAEQKWETPTTTTLAMVNSPALELYPHLSSDGLRLYLTSNRAGSYQLYVASRSTVGDAFGTPMPITELNDAPTEGGIWISADERYMILGRNDDLYESRR